MEDGILIPVSSQFPFTGVCNDILRELQKRNWQAEGLSVKFKDRCQEVMIVAGPDFKLRFWNLAYAENNTRTTAGVAELIIPRKELHVYSDESGPTLYLYVGANWENDQNSFVSDIKVMARYYRQPRRYIMYKGTCDCSDYAHTHPGRRSPVLAADNDGGRQYSPEGDEPRSFSTSEVFDEFTKFFEEVLKKIQAFPLPSASKAE